MAVNSILGNEKCSWPRWGVPLGLSVAWTLLNCLKPLHVDDAYFLMFARQIAAHPFDPYGFRVFWYQWPEPAWWAPGPPVFLYWLAVPMRLGLVTPWVLKLWMFPFAAAFCFSLFAMLSAVAKEYAAAILGIVALSPLFLCGLNLMIDVPAVALALLGQVCFYRAVERGSWRWAILSGVVCGLAMQTKWSCLTTPGIILAFAVVFKRMRLGAIAILVSLLLFTGWELFSLERYGQSNFIASLATANVTSVESKLAVAWKLPAYLGGTAPLLIVPALLAMRFRLLPAALAVLAVGGCAGAYYAVLDARLATGIGLVAVVLGIAAAIPWLWKGEIISNERMRIFLVIWVAIQIGTALATSPFAAGRRVMGVAAALSVLFGHLLGGRGFEVRRLWIARAAVLATAGLGVFFFWIDCDDANVIRLQAEKPYAMIRSGDPNSRIWYLGHFGFQYYAERLGMVAAIPDASVLEPGDWLVISTGTEGPEISVSNSAIGTPTQIREVWKSKRTALSNYGGAKPMDFRKSEAAVTFVCRIKKETQLHTVPPTLLAYANGRPKYFPPDGLEALVQLLKWPDAEARKEAAGAVCDVGAAALELAGKDSNPAIRAWAAEPDAIRRTSDPMETDGNKSGAEK